MVEQRQLAVFERCESWLEQTHIQITQKFVTYATEVTHKV